MIKNTIADLEKSIAGVDAGKKKELLALLGRLKGELSELEGKHASLRVSIKDFEATHPQLVEAVNEICGFLAKLGI
jgi:hypothetical protein